MMPRMTKMYHGIIGRKDHRHAEVVEHFLEGPDRLQDHSYYLPERETDGILKQVGNISWGFYGGGPSVFGMSILSDLYGEAVAKRHWYAFTKEVVARLPPDNEAEISSAAVEGWMQTREPGAAADLACRCPR